MALTTLECSDDRIGALREMLCELMRRGELRKQYFGMMSGLDIKYDVGNGHPLVGYRMPDLELTSVNGPLRGSSHSFTTPARCFSTWANLARLTSLHGWIEFSRSTRSTVAHGNFR